MCLGPCICRLFLFRYTNCQSKNGKRTLYPFFVFLSAIRKKENDYKQTILVFLIYERKRKTVQQTVFRFLCIRTENEMRLQRHSFSVFRFPFFVFRSSRSQLVCTCATRLRSCVWRVGLEGARPRTTTHDHARPRPTTHDRPRTTTKDHARPRTTTHDHARPRTTTHDHARPTTHAYARPRTTTNDHARPRTTTHYHARPSTTTNDRPRTTTHAHERQRTTTHDHARPRTTTHDHARPRTTMHVSSIRRLPYLFGEAVHVVPPCERLL